MPTTEAVVRGHPNQAHVPLPMVWGWCPCTWFGRPQATCHGMGQSCLAPWLTPNKSNNLRKNSPHTSVHSVTLSLCSHSLYHFYFTHASLVYVLCISTCPLRYIFDFDVPTYWIIALSLHCVEQSWYARPHRRLPQFGQNCSEKAVHYRFSCFFMPHTCWNYLLFVYPIHDRLALFIYTLKWQKHYLCTYSHYE